MPQCEMSLVGFDWNASVQHDQVDTKSATTLGGLDRQLSDEPRTGRMMHRWRLQASGHLHKSLHERIVSNMAFEPVGK
jgi:hypothetical protein